MADIVLAPNREEWELGQAELEALAAALSEDGHDVWLQEPRDGEYSQGGIVIDPVIDVSLFVFERIADETAGAIVALALDRLLRPGKRKRKAKGVLYGPDAEVLREFEMPPSHDSN